MTLQVIATATTRNPTLQAIQYAIRSGLWQAPPVMAIIASDFQNFKTICEQLPISDVHNIILPGTNIVIPKSLQQRVNDSS